MLGTSDWAGKGMLGDELEDLRLDLSGFNTDEGLGREGECKGDVRGKGTAMGDSSVEEEPSSSSKWKVGRLGVRCGRAPRETNGPALCSEWNIVGAYFQNQVIICKDSPSISGRSQLPFSLHLAPPYVNLKSILSNVV
jgi:hypothetical protein